MTTKTTSNRLLALNDSLPASIKKHFNFDEKALSHMVSKYCHTDSNRDRENELYYFNHRWYDPASMRFLSKDPAGMVVSDPRTINRYTFVNNNPLRYYDPDGRFWSEMWQFTSSTAAHSIKKSFQYGLISAGVNMALGNDLHDAVPGAMLMGAGVGALQGASYGLNAFNKPGLATIEVSAEDSQLHELGIGSNERAEKMIGPNGRHERVRIINDVIGEDRIPKPQNMATFNIFGNDQSFKMFGKNVAYGKVLHGVADVPRWIAWGTSPEDTTKLLFRSQQAVSALQNMMFK
jgi:RHS repeat-associated protein